jgi:ribosomal protein L40E
MQNIVITERMMLKMDFLRDLFDFGDRKRRKRGGINQNEDHHDDDHDDDHDHHQPYPNSSYPQVSTNPDASLPGVVCRNCSAQTVQGAKFCHRCGTAIDVPKICASCGSKLPTNALFCPQCGSTNG